MSWFKREDHEIVNDSQKTVRTEGLSGTDAQTLHGDPIIAQDAPPAKALAKSPENLIPPSAITGTPCLSASSALMEPLHSGASNAA